jgi:hypothetical protein
MYYPTIYKFINALNNTDYEYKVETSPTCTLTGKDSYTIIVDGQTFKFEVITEELGHTAGEAVKENNVNPTCETDGHYDSVVYCSVCGEELSRDTITVDKLGHNYGEPEFVWDGYTAKAVFTCTIDEIHKKEIQAVITSVITKESTFEETGLKVYTATVIFNNQTYTSTKEEILDKLDPVVEFKKVIDSMSKTDSAEVLQAKLAQANQLYSMIENKESVQEEYNTLEEYQNYYESFTNPNNDSKSNGLSGGAIAGIIAGSVAVIAAITVGGFFILKKKKSV